jgi:O-methyltransferase involved in polyketide biosynthesis
MHFGFPRDSDAISPTAHYTGEVWRRNGLGHDALGTRQGRLLFESLQPLMALSRTLGGDTLEGFLLARHRLIDALLEAAIEAGNVGQVIEIAAGMSPRGLTFSARHPDLTYVEGDLPVMAARKRAALAKAGGGHRVADFDALADDGPTSLTSLAAGLDRERGLAVISEGLINYFPRPQVDGLWARIATTLRDFRGGIYLSDLFLQSGNAGGVQRAFGALLGAFVRGRVHFPYADADQAEAALAAAGFDAATLHPGTEGGSGPGAERVTVIEARVAG